MRHSNVTLLALALSTATTLAGTFVASSAAASEQPWYERLRIRGYSQVRTNHLYQSNPDLINSQADRSIGGESDTFMVRRARLIVQGFVTPKVAVYLQTDAASLLSENTAVVTVRDWYADMYLTDEKESRFRVGTSKVPYGFENMQSSQNRLPIDRTDAINSGAPNERDLGVFFYWAPSWARHLFKKLVDDGLKGSGDYGVLALGVYAGQSANKLERSENVHAVARVSVPISIGGQILEVGVGGYAGKFGIKKDKGIGGVDLARDIRVAASFTLYPRPWLVQGEYNVGIGPELDAAAKVVREQRLHGGYLLVGYRVEPFIPYVRVQTYDGGKKFETNAPSYRVRELEAGVEAHLGSAVEIVGAWVEAERTNPATGADVRGRLLRLQLQFNY